VAYLIVEFHCCDHNVYASISIGSRNTTIDRGRFTPGRHTLVVTFITQGGQMFSTPRLSFNGKLCNHALARALQSTGSITYITIKISQGLN
jgi:hypothetical protein